MAIKTIFFDLDDTLHDHLFPFLSAFNKVFPILTKQIDIEQLYKRFRDYSDLLWIQYSNNKISLEELRAQRITLALESFNVYIKDSSASEFQKQYELGLNTLQIFPDVPELFETITKKGYKIGIITNGPIEHQFNKIKSLGLTDYIPNEWIFISDEVGIAKPNPQLFSYVAQKLNLFPEETLFVGDSWPNDVVAPMEAGWKAIWYNHRKRQAGTDNKPAAEINHLTSVLNILNDLK